LLKSSFLCIKSWIVRKSTDDNLRYLLS